MARVASAEKTACCRISEICLCRRGPACDAGHNSQAPPGGATIMGAIPLSAAAGFTEACRVTDAGCGADSNTAIMRRRKRRHPSTRGKPELCSYYQPIILVPQPSIAFISTYSHPSRDSMEHMLREAFPDFELHDIELMKVVKANARWAPANALHAAAEFGGKVLAGRMDMRNAYLRTTYLMRKLRAAMPGVIDPRQYAFSFQTQSMY